MEYWIKSAECMRRTGAWLAVCLPDGKLAAIADYFGADDPGHALLLSLAAVILGRPMSVIDIIRINILINYAGLLATATLLFVARCHIATLVTLLMDVEVYLYWVGFAPHPALIGTSGLAAFLPLGIVLSERGLLRPSAQLPALGAGAVLLGVATLIRESIGMMSLLISLAALAWLAWRRRVPRRPLRLLALLALLIAARQTPRWVLLARDAAFGLQLRTLSRRTASRTVFTWGPEPSRTALASSGATTVKASRPPKPSNRTSGTHLGGTID